MKSRLRRSSSGVPRLSQTSTSCAAKGDLEDPLRRRADRDDAGSGRAASARRTARRFRRGAREVEIAAPSPEERVPHGASDERGRDPPVARRRGRARRRRPRGQPHRAERGPLRRGGLGQPPRGRAATSALHVRAVGRGSAVSIGAHGFREAAGARESPNSPPAAAGADVLEEVRGPLGRRAWARGPRPRPRGGRPRRGRGPATARSAGAARMECSTRL